MRKFDDAELRKLTSDQIVSLISSRAHFVVVTDKPTGSRIFQFLENEKQFRQSTKSLRCRVGYLKNAWVGFFLLDFLQLWITSVNKGYDVTVVETNLASVEIQFRC